MTYTIVGSHDLSDEEYVYHEADSYKAAWELAKKMEEEDVNYEPYWIEDPNGEPVVDFLH